MAFRNKLQNDVPEANVTGNTGRSSEYENLSKSDNYLNNIVVHSTGKCVCESGC